MLQNYGECGGIELMMQNDGVEDLQPVFAQQNDDSANLPDGKLAELWYDRRDMRTAVKVREEPR